MTKNNLPTVYQAVIAQSRYARFMPDQQRRETWEETVQRLITYLEEKTPVLKKDIASIKEAVLKQDIMPSMRLMMTAGEACERDNISAYNCSYLAVNNSHMICFNTY